MTEKSSLAPIVLFVYNRPEHTARTVESLKINPLAKDSRLFIFSDGPKSEKDESAVRHVRDYIHSVDGFESVHIEESLENKGLAASVIAGVTAVVDRFARVIVLEDDLEVSDKFLDYMNTCLARYEDHSRVFSVSAYSLPPRKLKIPSSYPYSVYFHTRNSSWGWGTWKYKWALADWEVKDYSLISEKSIRNTFDANGEGLSRMLDLQMAGKIDSWAIRWTYTHFLHNAYSVIPVKSYVHNHGIDGSGTHTLIKTKRYDQQSLNSEGKIIFPEKVIPDFEIHALFRQAYSRSLFFRLMRSVYFTFKRK